MASGLPTGGKGGCDGKRACLAVSMPAVVERVAFVIAEQEICGKLPTSSSSGPRMRIEELFDLMGVLATLVFLALVLGWLACSVSAALA